MEAILIQLVVAVVLALVASAFIPKPKAATPEAAQELEVPTADAGKPIPVVFGTITIKSPNIIWYGEKGINLFKVKE